MKRKSKLYLAVWIALIVSLVSFFASIIPFAILHSQEEDFIWRTADYITIPLLLISLVVMLVSSITFLALAVKVRKDAAKTGKNLQRSFFEFPYEGEKADIAREIDQYLKSKKFAIAKHSTGEMLYKKGDGFWTSMKCVKFTFNENGFRMEAFIFAMNILGAQEISLEGPVALFPKISLLKNIDEIESIINSHKN